MLSQVYLNVTQKNKFILNFIIFEQQDLILNNLDVILAKLSFMYTQYDIVCVTIDKILKQKLI